MSVLSLKVKSSAVGCKELFVVTELIGFGSFLSAVGYEGGIENQSFKFNFIHEENYLVRGHKAFTEKKTVTQQKHF